MRVVTQIKHSGSGEKGADIIISDLKLSESVRQKNGRDNGDVTDRRRRSDGQTGRVNSLIGAAAGVC